MTLESPNPSWAGRAGTDTGTDIGGPGHAISEHGYGRLLRHFMDAHRPKMELSRETLMQTVAVTSESGERQTLADFIACHAPKKVAKAFGIEHQPNLMVLHVWDLDSDRFRQVVLDRIRRGFGESEIRTAAGRSIGAAELVREVEQETSTGIWFAGVVRRNLEFIEALVEHDRVRPADEASDLSSRIAARRRAFSLQGR